MLFGAALYNMALATLGRCSRKPARSWDILTSAMLMTAALMLI